MCGIVGYIGDKLVAPILLEGLSKLEYRGYDSAGIAVCDENGVTIEKAVGKLENLYKKTDNGTTISGTKGIGHTRWATHGKPTEENAHPHKSERFVLVHNGIIENEEFLRSKYLKGVNFVSETDTEIIPWLLDKFTQSGEDTEMAIRHLMSEIVGSYALAIIDRENPDVLYAVKNKSPLLIGKGEGFNMIGSDSMAMIANTNMFFEIHDKEYVVITKETVKIYTQYGKLIDRAPFKAELDLSDTEKGTYAHFMIKEIEEQPAVIRRLIQKYADENGDISVDKAIVNDIQSCDKIYIIACGTSYHAGLVGKQLFETMAKKPCDSYIASEFVHNTPLLSEKPFFIFISQSGETADSRAVMVKVKAMGHKILTITNVKGSTLSREANYTLLLHAGPEIAVASTKAYTAQIAVLAILASTVAKEPGLDIKYELSKVANVIETICSESETYKYLAEKYLKNARNAFYIGRCVDYYVCLEAALKLKEISYIQAEGFAAGELKHGTIALIEKGTPVIAIITQENINLNTRSNIEEVKARGAKTLVISTSSLSSHNDKIVIRDVHPLLAPIVSVVPTQYIAYYAALCKGRDIDKPRNLAKSVTVE
ncbi:MAG: glutamine--fructose-6-phosphate transaminase (isomerizing) [Clostridia bacterium]|nr:glutamine--fructose-6-phosphate transaminase (isomerizing) [Clostridia bacterium]